MRHVVQNYAVWDHPHVVLFLGTDILEGDPLGALSISPQVRCVYYKVLFVGTTILIY